MGKRFNLGRELGRMLGGGQKRREPDTDRRERDAFRKIAVEKNFTFTKTRDGYLDTTAFEGFPKGFHTAFHGWPETLERLRACMVDPSIMDEDGYYTE